MDPKACIELAESHAEEGNPEDAAWALQDYREWRRKGGFTDAGLDERARTVARQIKGMGGHPGVKLGF
jgi:hypothetical protein